MYTYGRTVMAHMNMYQLLVEQVEHNVIIGLVLAGVRQV